MFRSLGLFPKILDLRHVVDFHDLDCELTSPPQLASNALSNTMLVILTRLLPRPILRLWSLQCP